MAQLYLCLIFLTGASSRGDSGHGGRESDVQAAIQDNGFARTGFGHAGQSPFSGPISTAHLNSIPWRLECI